MGVFFIPKNHKITRRDTMSKIIRCAIYIRVSSAEQVMHGHSLDAQVRFLTDYAHKHKWKVVGVYADEGKTARKELKRRKAIKELLNHVEADEIDMILFWKMDRWFRNVADFYKVQDILDAHNCKWTAAAEPSMNLETREGRLNVNIMLSINQNETDTTSERIKFVNESSVKQGKAIVGTPSMPLGYKVIPVDGIKRVVKDPEKEALVNEIFEYYFAHQSKIGTIKYFNEKYGYTLGTMGIEKITTSTLYYGCYRDNENYCPAYITKEQYNMMQEINRNNIRIYKSQNRDGNNPYIFTGLFLCPECRHKMAGMKRATKTKYIRRYYRCPEHYTKKNCSYGKVMNEITAEDYLLNNVEHLFMKSRMDYQYDVQERKKLIKKINTDATKYQKELERLNNMYQKGRISENTYDSEYERLSELIASCKIIPIKEARTIRDYDKINDVFVTNWKQQYESLDREHRRIFWRNIIDHMELSKEHGEITEVHFLR